MLPRARVDTVYIAASRFDARYTRICAASVRHFYPEIRIRLLPGGRLQKGLVGELQRYWEVEVADLPTGEYGWGFVKLEPLFGQPGERFLVLDSDTVLTGPILDVWTRTSDAVFLVDDEKQSEADTNRLYYDWKQVRATDRAARSPAFVFNTGQWFGTAGILSREDFDEWVEWSLPRRLRHATWFMPGEQGVLNYVLNQKAALSGLVIERRKIMHWPGRGMSGLDASSVATRSCPSTIVHWAGLKRTRQRDMIGADLLGYFENVYYHRLPAGRLRRLIAGTGDVMDQAHERLRVLGRLSIRRLARASSR